MAEIVTFDCWGENSWVDEPQHNIGFVVEMYCRREYHCLTIRLRILEKVIENRKEQWQENRRH